MRVVMASAETLSVLVFEEEQPLASMRFDMIHVTRNYDFTFDHTQSALRFLGKPVPFDRLPGR
jgi:hypothetical protein